MIRLLEYKLVNFLTLFLQIPDKWLFVGCDSENLLSYLNQLTRKSKSIKQIYEKKIKMEEILKSTPINMGIFFKPKNLINSLRQYTAR